jgi:hypothetical protein
MAEIKQPFPGSPQGPVFVTLPVPAPTRYIGTPVVYGPPIPNKRRKRKRRRRG